MSQDKQFNRILQATPHGLSLWDQSFRSLGKLLLLLAFFGSMQMTCVFFPKLFGTLSSDQTLISLVGCFILFAIPALMLYRVKSGTHFDAHRREVIYKSPFHGEEEHIPFSNIQAMTLESEIRTRRGPRRADEDYRVWIIGLEQIGKEETTQLYTVQDEILANRIVETIAKAYQFPIYDKTSGQNVIRKPEELDTPFYQREDFTPYVNDVSAMPSGRIKVSPASMGGCIIEIKGAPPNQKNTMQYVILIGAFLMLPMMFVDRVQKEFGEVPEISLLLWGAFLLILLAGVGFYYIINHCLLKRILTMNAEGVRYVSRLLFVSTPAVHIPLSKIEAIQIEKDIHGEKLAFKSDEQVLSIDRLEESDLQWLQQQAYQYLRG